MGKTLPNENVDRFFSLAKNIVKACAHMIQVSHTICRPGVCNHPESARFLNTIRSLMLQNFLKTLVAESYTLRTNNRMRQLCRWNYPKDQSEGWYDNFSLQKRQSYGQSRPLDFKRTIFIHAIYCAEIINIVKWYILKGAFFAHKSASEHLCPDPDLNLLPTSQAAY